MLAIGCWLLAFGCWILAVGFWLLAFGCWLLAVSSSFTIVKLLQSSVFGYPIMS